MRIRETRSDGGRLAAPGDGARAVRASVAASMAGKAAEMVTLLLLATVVPRVLGPRDYGRFSVPLTVVTLGSLALTLGGPVVMGRFVPRAPQHERLALARSIGMRLARGRALQLGAIALAGTGLVLLDPDTFPPFDTVLVLVALVLNVAATLALQVALGLGRTGAWSFRYPLQNAVLVGTVLVLRDSAGGTGGVVAIVIAAVVAAVLAGAVIGPILRADAPTVPVPEGAMRFGALQATGAALVQFTHRGGVLVTAVLASAAETGFVALATGIALGVTYAVLQAFTVSLPHLAADGDADPRPESVLRRLAGWLLAALVPATLVAAATIEWTVPRVFGDDYAAATDAFVPAVALVVLAPLNALLVQVAALRMRPDVAAGAGGLSAVTFLAVAVVLVPAWGATGATSAALGGAAAGALYASRRLPGAAGRRIALVTAAGTIAVLAIGGWT